MTYFSHAKKDEVTGKKRGSKKLTTHIEGVQSKAKARVTPTFNFDKEGLDFYTLLSDIGLFHDLGKYTPHFQDYLVDRPHERILKQHARFGAHVVFQKYKDLPEIAYIAYFVILNHHRSLHYPANGDREMLFRKLCAEDVEKIFEKQKASILPKISTIKEEININNLEDLLVMPVAKDFRKFVKKWLQNQQDIQHYFLINYLFSLLIEADKLDASETEVFVRKQLPASAVDDFLSPPPSNLSEQNMLRNEVRQKVIEKLGEIDVEQDKLFLLTAPTGIGKTFTALDFALKLRAKLKHNPQIITGLPFINIIEQTLKEYSKILQPEQAKIIGHYQYADIFGNQTENDEENKDKSYNVRRMELDTWQADIVVTSFVQLLQTIISNKNKSLLKFNHLAGAIVIMDEVQSLRLEQVPGIGAVLYFMSHFLGTRFILMTATKPLIFELTDKEVLIPIFEIESMPKVIPLLYNPEYYFKKFHRTQIAPLIESQLEANEDFVKIFAQKWTSDKACLIVVNKVNRSLDLFAEIEKYLNENDCKNPLHYLSTNILPVHRLEIIETIKKQISAAREYSDSLPPILIATQVVEAGVDLDFDMGFRDLGPIDSIVQVAGRINRENSIERKYSPLYIFNTGDCDKIYGRFTDIQAKKALGNTPILEPQYFLLVEKYFSVMSDTGSYSCSRKLVKGILGLHYDGVGNDEATPIDQFKIIKESSFNISVFVEWDEDAIDAKEAFLLTLTAKGKKGKAAKEDFGLNHKKNFHQHIIAVPKYLTDELFGISEEFPDIQIKLVEHDVLENFYQLPTGFIRKATEPKNSTYCL